MKGKFRLINLILVLLICVCSLCGCVSITTPFTVYEKPNLPEHQCYSSCDECGKCLNGECEQSACSEKCLGHQVVDNSAQLLKQKAYAYSPSIPSQMPRVSVTTNDNNKFATKYTSSKGVDYTDCTVSVENCQAEHQIKNAVAGIRVRGNATVTYAKKPFRIKFDKKQNMLGLNGGAKCKSWVLLAEYKDSSFLRNSVAFYLGNTVLGSDGLYTTDYMHVELYLNGQYWGVYLLAEQQQVDFNRVNVGKPEEGYEGVDIGYFFEYDGYYNNEAALEKFTIDYGGKPVVKRLNGSNMSYAQSGYAIKNDIYSQAQNDFLKWYLNGVYTIMYEAAYNDNYLEFDADYTCLVASEEKTAKAAIARSVNIQSVVDTYILNEICCDYDINWSSFYLSADLSPKGDGKLTLQAPWDFDSSLGLKNACASGKEMFVANSNNPWLVVLITEDWFMDMVKEKWSEMKDNGVLKNVLNLIDTFATTNGSYYEQSFEKWGNINIQLPDNLLKPVVNCKTHAEAADYLKGWLYTRLNYLNGQFGDGTDVLTGEIITQ
ncbi:MAG: CotH kinase family protein [Clostridia bacterium]|nr:CotH kinase family protein [Clostridia bacterium]